MTFEVLGLSGPLLKGIRDIGYVNPTQIQKKSIPNILAGLDVVGSAETGTGKTAGFVLPMLQLLDRPNTILKFRTRSLILCPTRELADQIYKSVISHGKFLSLKATVVYGGVSINPQKKILKNGVDILIATPGRLLDLSNQNAIKFDRLEIFVADEADRMLDMGFIKDIKKIVSMLPQKRQNLLFSATFPNNIKKLINSIAKNPIQVDVNAKSEKAVYITERFFTVEKNQKTGLLKELIKKENWYQALVFVRTKRGADALARRLKKQDLICGAIHGDKSQRQRMKVLEDFKMNTIQILICTDIVARGIDICGLPYVVNYDMPYMPEDYIHRIGRTGRAGEKGTAVSFVSIEEKKILNGIEKFTKKKVKLEICTFDDNIVFQDVPKPRKNEKVRTSKSVKLAKSARMKSNKKSKRTRVAQNSK